MAGFRAGIQDDGSQTALSEVITDGKTGLAPTDDDDVERRCPGRGWVVGLSRPSFDRIARSGYAFRMVSLSLS